MVQYDVAKYNEELRNVHLDFTRVLEAWKKISI